MSADYSIRIKRKIDNKEIAHFSCNAIKTLIDSPYKNAIHLSSNLYANNNGCKFYYIDLANMSKLIEKDLGEKYNDIHKNTLLISIAKSQEAINNYEEKIQYDKEAIEDLLFEYSACHNIMGMICCIVEDIYKNDTPAYQYNAEGSGKPSVWVDDVFCQIEVSY